MKKDYNKDGVLLCKQTVINRKEKRLCLMLDGYTDKANISFGFDWGLMKQGDVRKLWRLSDYLTKNSRGGVIALLKYSAEPEESRKRKDICPDEVFAGTTGNFCSELKVEKGTLLYEVELCCVGCCGKAEFNFGIAYKGKTSKIQRIVTEFEDYLMGFVYTVKHHYIDNMPDIEEDGE